MGSLKKLHSNKAGKVGLVILSIFIFIAVFAPFIAPHNPWVPGTPFLSPSWGHPLGTNDIGQDIFSELIYSARISLLIGFLAAFVTLVIGSLIGIVSGYYRGIVEEVLMGFTDVFLLIPSLPLLIILVAYLRPSIWIIILVIGFMGWEDEARIVRSQVLTVREIGYVEASKAIGTKNKIIMFRHVLPNVMPIILAKFILSVAGAMLTEAALSFLGFGDPIQKSWGTMLHYAFSMGGFVNNFWWWYLPPGLCISLAVLGFTLISFSFEEKADPRLRRMIQQ